LVDFGVAGPLDIEYDLSLITADENGVLPDMTLPPTFPVLETTFASPEEILGW